MANEGMTMSAGGLERLREREGVVQRYYNDAAQNCTLGVGTLVHHGPCTAQELATPVTNATIDTQLRARVTAAEASVRAGVPDHQLTQGQFDSLVSFVYNVGAGGARATLAAANAGTPAEAARHMNENVYVRPRDRNGNRGAPVRLQGLVNRRREEAAPFIQAAPR